jgi:predicted RNA-binding Zn-ribbon protein involved in translation (DUF1610 family)
MSERITWETCPACGRTAAVGWQPVGRGEPAEDAVEFDCPSGCELTESEVHDFALMGERPRVP